ncbi:hypothetical protein DJ522_08960, partial [Sulfolobus sp. F3]
RLKISPVIAYLLGGVLATTYLGVSFNSSYFSILNFLALNLLAFEIGASFDISRARELFRKALSISLVELILITLLSYYFGLYLLHLGPLLSLFLVMASIDTSTSILYKIAGNKLDKNTKDLLIAVASIEDIEVFFLYSIAVAANGSFNPIRKMYQNILSKMEECKKCKDCEVCDTVEELLDQLSYSLEKVQANDEKER